MTWTKLLIALFVFGWALFAWALCAAAKRGDELMADMQRAEDFTRWEAQVRP